MKSNNTCVGHNSEHLCQMWLNSVQCFSSRPWKCCKLWSPLATIFWNQLALAYGQPMRNCSSALNLSVVCILPRNCTEGSGVCLDRMRDCFWFVKNGHQETLKIWFNDSISIRNTCEYDIIVLPLSVDQSKKMEANAFIKMAQFYNNLIMKRSKI
jgi:hypothetical protein